MALQFLVTPYAVSFNDSGWIAYDEAVVRNGFQYDGAGSDNDVVADGDATQDDGASIDTHVVTNDGTLATGTVFGDGDVVPDLQVAPYPTGSESHGMTMLDDKARSDVTG